MILVCTGKFVTGSHKTNNVFLLNKTKLFLPLSLAAWPAARTIWVFTLKQTKELLLFAKQLIAVAMIHPHKYVNELPQAERFSFLYAAIMRLLCLHSHVSYVKMAFTVTTVSSHVTLFPLSAGRQKRTKR